MFQDYKAQREKVPDALVPLFSLTPKIVQAFGVKCVSCNGFEADDVMASLGKWAKDRGLNAVHVSADKDMLQLVDTGVHVMIPNFNNTSGVKMMGVAEVIEKYGLHPRMMPAYQAIIGDTADNIPGVSGIGQKIGAALIRRFETVHAMYDQLGITKLALPESLRDAAHNAPELISHLQSALTPVGYTAAVNLLSTALQGVRVAPAKVFSLLCAVSLAEVLINLKLVTLSQDIPVEDMVFHYEDHEHFPSLAGTVPYPVNSKELWANGGEKSISTDYFRYRGEDPLKQQELEAYLSTITPGLLPALQLLRQQYHLLDRN